VKTELDKDRDRERELQSVAENYTHGVRGGERV